MAGQALTQLYGGVHPAKPLKDCSTISSLDPAATPPPRRRTRPRTRTRPRHGTWRVRAELVPLRDAVLSTSRPTSTLTWFANPQVPALLTDMARGAVPITHEALSQLPDWCTAAFMHELLMHHGVPPKMDKRLMLFERWLTTRLATIQNPDHAQVIGRFATWNEPRRLRAGATRHTLRPATTQQSGQRINWAIDFLAWLTERNTSLRTCAESDVDAWYVVKYATRRPTHAFLSWAMTAGLLPRITLPRHRTSNPAPMAQQRRLAMIGKLVESLDIAPRETGRGAARAVVCPVNTISRIAPLTAEDIILEEAAVALRIGDPPTPAPEPLAGLPRELLAQRNSIPGHQRRHDLAVPRPPTRATHALRKHSAISRATMGSPAKLCGPPRRAGSCYRPPLRWSRACSATTTRTPPGSSPRPAAPGAATHPVTTTNGNTLSISPRSSSPRSSPPPG